MNLGVGLRSICIRPSLFPALRYFKYYPHNSPSQRAFQKGPLALFPPRSSVHGKIVVTHQLCLFYFLHISRARFCPFVTSQLSFFSLMFMQTWPFGSWRFSFRGICLMFPLPPFADRAYKYEVGSSCESLFRLFLLLLPWAQRLHLVAPHSPSVFVLPLPLFLVSFLPFLHFISFISFIKMNLLNDKKKKSR